MGFEGMLKDPKRSDRKKSLSLKWFLGLPCISTKAMVKLEGIDKQIISKDKFQWKLHFCQIISPEMQ